MKMNFWIGLVSLLLMTGQVFAARPQPIHGMTVVDAKNRVVGDVLWGGVAPTSGMLTNDQVLTATKLDGQILVLGVTRDEIGGGINSGRVLFESADCSGQGYVTQSTFTLLTSVQATKPFWPQSVYLSHIGERVFYLQDIQSAPLDITARSYLKNADSTLTSLYNDGSTQDSTGCFSFGPDSNYPDGQPLSAVRRANPSKDPAKFFTPPFRIKTW